MVYNEQDMKRLSVIFCVAMLLGSSACVFNESGVGPMDDTDAGNTNTDTNANTNTNANINANTNDNTNQSPELCADGAVSGDETDVDCGGVRGGRGLLRAVRLPKPCVRRNYLR